MSMLEHALEYHSKGYNIIPVGKDKRPLLQSWKPFQIQPATQEQITNWWTQAPNANIAAICGVHSGFFVVDVDNGADITGLNLPPTKIVKTGSGGFHYYYKWNEKLSTVPNTVGLRPHVDLRGEGSYILLPPSINSKGTYELVVDENMADLPLNIVAPSQKTLGFWRDKLRGVQAGTRNASAASLIGGLAKAIPPIYWEDTLWPFVEWWNLNRCQPPLSKQELSTTFNSICTRSLHSNWASWTKE